MSAEIPTLDHQAFTQLPRTGVLAIDFTAAWCGPCKIMKPVLAALAAEYAGRARIVAIDVDQEQLIAQQYDVRSMPTLVILRDGREVGRVVGTRTSWYRVNVSWARSAIHELRAGWRC